MDGGIYTREKCHECGKSLKHDSGRKGCFCPDHPKVKATSFIVKFPGGIYQRHQSYENAAQALNHLRYEKGNRSDRFDPDDYKTARPNSFASLAPKYFDRKSKLASFRKIKSIIERATSHFYSLNMREITGGDLDDYLYGIPDISEKTRHNHCSQLHDFWTWCYERGVIRLDEFPKFPKIDYELGYRKITNWDIQEKVISKVREMYAVNPKIGLAVDMLAQYTALRPDDLRRVNESSFDEKTGWLTIHNPTKKKNKFKYIKLHQDHIDEWKAIQKKFPALPETPFFRHVTSIRRAKQGILFGPNFLSKVWNRASKEVGLEGVPLYPGTKHTTATETAKMMGSEKALNASGLTNKAFERYCQLEKADAIEVVNEIRKAKKKGHVISINRAKKGTE